MTSPDTCTTQPVRRLEEQRHYKGAMALGGRAAQGEGLERGRRGARWETGGAEAMKERPGHVPAVCSYLAAEG